MSPMTLVEKNGSKPHVSPPAESWLTQKTREFFAGINWDDNPPEVQELTLTVVQGGDAAGPLSLLLNVRQFFAAVNWDGTAIAPTPSINETAAPQPPVAMDFTLEDFSDLF